MKLSKPYKKYLTKATIGLYSDYTEWLKDVYQELKKISNSLTMQHFSESLGLSGASYISQIINGHRPLSEKKGLLISSRLGLDETESQYLIQLIRYQHADNTTERDYALLLLQELQARMKIESEPHYSKILKNWYNLVIYEVVGNDKKVKNASDIRKQLCFDVGEKEIEKALGVLKQAGLIARNSNGFFYQLQKEFRTDQEVPGMDIVNFHNAMINNAKNALFSIPPEQRNIAAVSFAIPENNLENFKDEINNFFEYILFKAKMSAKGSDQKKIVQMNIQLFPLTKINQE